MKANMNGAMGAAAYDLLDAIRSAHTGKRCVLQEIAAMPAKCRASRNGRLPVANELAWLHIRLTPLAMIRTEFGHLMNPS